MKRAGDAKLCLFAALGLLEASISYVAVRRSGYAPGDWDFIHIDMCHRD